MSLKAEIGRRHFCLSLASATIGGMVGSLIPYQDMAAFAKDFALQRDQYGYVTLRATIIPALGAIPLYVADKNGYLDKRKIKLQLTPGLDFAGWIYGLDQQFDIVMLVMPTTVQSKAAGVDLIAFGGGEDLQEDKHSTTLLTKINGVNSLEDLAKRGGTVAVGLANDLTKWSFSSYLEGTGQSATSLHLITIPFAEMGDQLRSGNVDAAAVPPGFNEALIAEGYRVIWEHPKSTMIKGGAKLPLVWVNFVASSSFAKANPEIVKDVQAAIEEAVEWITSHPDETLKAYGNWIGAPYETVRNLQIPGWKPKVDLTDASAWVKRLDEGKMLENKVDPPSLIPDVFQSK